MSGRWSEPEHAGRPVERRLRARARRPRGEHHRRRSASRAATGPPVAPYAAGPAVAAPSRACRSRGSPRPPPWPWAMPRSPPAPRSGARCPRIRRARSSLRPRAGLRWRPPRSRHRRPAAPRPLARRQWTARRPRRPRPGSPAPCPRHRRRQRRNRATRAAPYPSGSRRPHGHRRPDGPPTTPPTRLCDRVRLAGARPA